MIAATAVGMGTGDNDDDELKWTKTGHSCQQNQCLSLSFLGAKLEQPFLRHKNSLDQCLKFSTK